MKNSRAFYSPLMIIFAVFVLCCLCAGGIAAASFVTNSQRSASSPLNPVATLSISTPTDAIPTLAPTLPPQTAEPTLSQPTLAALDAPNYGGVTETLTTLENTIVPINDPIDLARRLEHHTDLQISLQPPPTPHQIGDQEKFWVNDTDTNKNFQVSATLRYTTDHVYFWIQDGVRYKASDLKALVDTFEEKIYPTDREFFGSEWTPGVDADPHLYILYARGLGGSVAGYFSSNDEYLPPVHKYTNGHEMFLLSVDHVDLGEQFAYSVLAHEFQHMIHWYRDRNEETWMNEGSSDLASFLNGYSIGGHDRIFAQNPDIQLND